MMMKKFHDRKLTYVDEDTLIDEYGNPIMKGWEKDWMSKSAEIVCQNGGSILNIGYGLGLIDKFIQTYNISHHTIVESHPDVHKKIMEDGWLEKPNVTVIMKKWQDYFPYITKKFDGIYFDAYDILAPMDAGGEGFLSEFITNLHKILKPDGVFSFWPGPIFESHRATHIQWRNNLAAALQPTFTLEKQIFNYSNTETSNKRFEYLNTSSYTVPVITYRKTPLIPSLI